MKKNKGFKMKGSSLYGKLNLNRGGQGKMADGRPKSSALQMHEAGHKEEKKGEPDKDITGHGGSKTPDVMYKSDGTAVKTSQIDEELLDLKPSIGPKGKFVNYTAEDGTKIKYHYKKP